MSSLQERGFVIKATGYENDSHWTGQREFAHGDPDIEFWRWLHQHRRLLPPILDESFLPALKAFAATEPSIITPPDAVYLNRESHGVVVDEAVASLVKAIGESGVTHFFPSHSVSDTDELMALFCRGEAEVFVFKDGACEFFGAIGQEREGIAMNIRLITKRAPATPDSQP